MVDPAARDRRPMVGAQGCAPNIWLHKQVMRKLEENGGNVPDDLKHWHSCEAEVFAKTRAVASVRYRTSSTSLPSRRRFAVTRDACADGFGRGEDIKIQIRPGGISRQGGWRSHHLQVREGSSRLQPGRARGFRLLHSRRQDQNRGCVRPR
jgi:hypothetical protein